MVSTQFVIGMLATGALATPLSAAAPFTNPVVGQMKWVGEVFPGVNYTFEGEARDIWNQIIAVNPEYVAKEVAGALPQKRGLETRAKQSNGWCGNFQAGDKNDFNSEACYLNRIGGTCSVGSQTCVRMACQSFSGAFLCNPLQNNFSISCPSLSSYVYDITGSCYNGPTPAGQTAWMSGQEFDDLGFNVVLSGSNCSASPSAQPPRVSGGPTQKKCNGQPGCIQQYPSQC